MRPPQEAARIRDAVAKQLALVNAQLSALGISWSGPDLEEWAKDEEIYTAELRVKFYRDDDLFDIFEFFLFQQGVPAASEPEVREWINENIESLMAQHASK